MIPPAEESSRSFPPQLFVSLPAQRGHFSLFHQRDHLLSFRGGTPSLSRATGRPLVAFPPSYTPRSVSTIAFIHLHFFLADESPLFSPLFAGTALDFLLQAASSFEPPPNSTFPRFLPAPPPPPFEYLRKPANLTLRPLRSTISS